MEQRTRFGAIGALAALAGMGFGGQTVATTSQSGTERPTKETPRPRASRLPLPMLNRSSRWRFARTYAEARAKSPFPDRPVR